MWGMLVVYRILNLARSRHRECIYFRTDDNFSSSNFTSTTSKQASERASDRDKRAEVKKINQIFAA